ncbi:MAG: DUF4256 domain-containing protein [Flavobacteriaceae bacterium]
MKKVLDPTRREELLTILQSRFEKNTHRHKGIQWADVQIRLEANPAKLWSLDQMEETGGEPDVIAYDKKTDSYIFCDCSAESPKGRRSLCYDTTALESRKEHKPKNSALAMAYEMGIEVLTEDEYFELQNIGRFDLKTSSWLKTPKEVRELGGSIFGDCRFGRVFIYHNGAESYYAARGFRGKLMV